MDHAYDVDHVTCNRCWSLEENRQQLERKAEKDREIRPTAERWSITPVPMKSSDLK